MRKYFMCNFIQMNQMEIQAVNLALNIYACDLQNAADILQMQADLKVETEGGGVSKLKSKWTKAWLRRRTQQGWYDALLKELAFEEKKDYFNFMRMDEQFFDEILTK